MNFAETIARHEQGAMKRFASFKAGVMISLGRAVILGSPVGNPAIWKINLGKEPGDFVKPPGYVGGRFRANWNFAVGHIDRKTTDAISPTGSISINALVAGSLGADAKATLYLTNSLPYAMGLEFEGKSTQAPSGMVRLNVERFNVIVKQALSAARP